MDRREFFHTMLGASVVGLSACHAPRQNSNLLRISLAEWSLHQTLYAGEMSHLDFPARARSYGIGAVEYVNTFFKDKARDQAYLTDLKDRCQSEGVHSVLIMCDGEGALGDPDPEARAQAVQNHHQWVEAAKFLGCHSIRVNAAGGGGWDESMKNVADGLHSLCQYGDQFGINVIVENHGGLSSNGAWLVGVMKMTNHPRVGTLPDFGNFKISAEETYNCYQGVSELMPWAKAVSAKSYGFDAQGIETSIDYPCMMEIIRAAGYTGYVGIEYEGGGLSEEQGILATRSLLERCGLLG
jgi:L-ribulose-5-phosphate 3-epimerase